MFSHDIADSGAEGDEENLRAFAAGELHRGNKIGVAGDEDDDVGLFFQCQRGDVQSEPHVHAFLVKRRGELPGFEGDFAVDGFGDGAANLPPVFPMPQLPEPQGDKRHSGKLIVERFRAAVRMGRTGGFRVFRRGRKRMGVVVIDAKQPMIAEQRMSAQVPDEFAEAGEVHGNARRSQPSLDESAVNEDGVGKLTGNRTCH